jgi:hypothetical protein
VIIDRQVSPSPAVISPNQTGSAAEVSCGPVDRTQQCIKMSGIALNVQTKTDRVHRTGCSLSSKGSNMHRNFTWHAAFRSQL